MTYFGVPTARVRGLHYFQIISAKIHPTLFSLFTWFFVSSKILGGQALFFLLSSCFTRGCSLIHKTKYLSTEWILTTWNHIHEDPVKVLKYILCLRGEGEELEYVKCWKNNMVRMNGKFARKETTVLSAVGRMCPSRRNKWGIRKLVRIKM